jgi:hypothetical protein
MQPYLFPYLGYFQLIQAADKFVVYDDIDFIKQGWINRNSILLNGAKYLFTIPVKNISSNAHINQTIISAKPINWEHKLLQTMVQAYKKAPCFHEVYPMLELVIRGSTDKTIASIATESIIAVMEYLSIKTELVQTSGVYKNNHLKNEERVIDICVKENASHYFNAIGGVELYSKENFLAKNIQLQFIKPGPVVYQQLQSLYVPGLSIIDAMMFNPVDEIVKFLNNYELA